MGGGRGDPHVRVCGCGCVRAHVQACMSARARVCVCARAR